MWRLLALYLLQLPYLLNLLCECDVVVPKISKTSSCCWSRCGRETDFYFDNILDRPILWARHHRNLGSREKEEERERERERERDWREMERVLSLFFIKIPHCKSKFTNKCTPDSFFKWRTSHRNLTFSNSIKRERWMNDTH